MIDQPCQIGVRKQLGTFEESITIAMNFILLQNTLYVVVEMVDLPKICCPGFNEF